MEEITNSKKRKREIRNEKLRKARQAKFEKKQRIEKISQFRRIADLQNSLIKEMYSILGLNSYPNRLVCLTIINNPLYTSMNSPLQVYETYLTENIIYYCATGGWKAGSLNQKICL